MGRPLADIDRLLDEGLTRYGRGDLDGALTSWEQVLELEPFRAAGPPDTTKPSGLSFEDATKEYDDASRGSPGADDGFEPEATPAFGSPGDAQTPQGFASQLTELRPRDLGFVQPVPPP